MPVEFLWLDPGVATRAGLGIDRRHNGARYSRDGAWPKNDGILAVPGQPRRCDLLARRAHGGETGRLAALMGMTDHLAPLQPGDGLDQLVDQLLNCSGVLSQIVSHMIEVDAAGFSSPDAAPIPEVAHNVVRDAVGETVCRHPEYDIETAARIIEEATNAVCENVFLVPSLDAQWPPNGQGRPLNRRARRQRRRGNGR
jgi:hypothetical protein